MNEVWILKKKNLNERKSQSWKGGAIEINVYNNQKPISVHMKKITWSLFALLNNFYLYNALGSILTKFGDQKKKTK